MVIKKLLILLATILISISFVSASQVIVLQDKPAAYKSSVIVSYHRDVNGCLERDVEVVNIAQPMYVKNLVIKKNEPFRSCNTPLKTFAQPYSSTPKVTSNQITTYKVGCYK
jgi:hypothetical protein